MVKKSTGEPRRELTMRSTAAAAAGPPQAAPSADAETSDEKVDKPKPSALNKALHGLGSMVKSFWHMIMG